MNVRCLCVVLICALSCATVHANDAQHIHASHGWIRVLPGDLPAGAYVTLQNDSDRVVSLTGASSPAYTEVMLHQSSTTGGMSRMTMVDALPIPAHGNAVLAPAGYHLMLMKAVHPIKPGDTVKLALKFGDGSTAVIDFVARPANTVDDDTNAGH
ncbi:copper chaperone PCu(A)C [Rhodanobacter sp. L36]|uniref:copper chaperone PCu(A)C n=1 Tax=Rhodanobacter sp. L36 TaxID=1747221 RepID=UPI00131CF574|nr:copper chaperone PCu(A)C [Rhodanobacter sp. L36]